MPEPFKDWTPRPPPERHEEPEIQEPQVQVVQQISFPTRKVISRRKYIQHTKTNDIEQNTNALHNPSSNPAPKQSNFSFLEEETFKDVSFRTNPQACENAVHRLKAIAFFSPGLMPMEQLSKL